MPIPKGAIPLTSDQNREVARLSDLLDKAITENPDNVHVSEQGKNPSPRVIAELKRIYEDPAMGWTLTTQADRDGMIIWLK